MRTLSECIVAGFVLSIFITMIVAAVLRKAGLDIERHARNNDEPCEHFPEGIHEHLL